MLFRSGPLQLGLCLTRRTKLCITRIGSPCVEHPFRLALPLRRLRTLRRLELSAGTNAGDTWTRLQPGSKPLDWVWLLASCEPELVSLLFGLIWQPARSTAATATTTTAAAATAAAAAVASATTAATSATATTVHGPRRRPMRRPPCVQSHTHANLQGGETHGRGA